MRILFAGTGSAFTMANRQTNLVFQHNGKNLMFDCGGDARHALAEAGLKPRDIDGVYVSHLHADHVGGLEWLAFASYFDPGRKDKPRLIANADLMRELWSSSLSGGLKCIQGKRTNLVDFFDVQSVRPNSGFEWEGVGFSIVQSVHVMDGYAIVPSYGLMFDVPGQPDDWEWPWRVFVTGDTQFNPNQIRDFYGQAELIVQDCETSPFRTGVHAHYDELKTLDPKVKAKMVLVHYQDNVIAADAQRPGAISTDWSDKARTDGFSPIHGTASVGFVPRGHVIDLPSWFRKVAGED